MNADRTKNKPRYNLWQNSGFMIALAWRHRKSVLGLIIAAVLLAVAGSLLSLFVTPAILQAVEQSVPLPEMLRLILLFSAGILIVASLASYVKTNSFFGRMGLRRMLGSAITIKMARTSYPNVESKDFRKKYETALNAIISNRSPGEAIWETLYDILRGIIGFIIYLLILSVLELWIIAVVLLTTSLSFFVTNHINGWGYRNRDESAEYHRRMNYAVDSAEKVALAKDVRIFGMGPWIKDIFESAHSLFHNFATRREKVHIWGNVVDMALALARNGIAYVYLIYLTINQDLPAALFLLYFTAVGGFTQWVNTILNGFSQLHKQSLDLSAMREYLGHFETFKFDDGEAICPDSSMPYELELRDVTFRYPGAQKDIIANVNLKIAAGERLAIVGLNGAGKTTLVKLLCGLYDPIAGQVLLNGQDIRKYNRRDYYRHFSAVFQDFSVLGVSIADNIAQDSKVDSERLAYAAELAGLTEKINSLSEKFETKITKDIYDYGIQLSGGETQRLMLARALYKDAPIIILDEPTAALDPIAEADLYRKYNDLTSGRTSIFISHRLASTRFCDRIILLDEGGVIEEGSHESLASQGGRYAELFEIQSHYYRGGGELNERQG